MSVIELDVRFLEHPAPFEKTVEALDRLAPHDELHLLIHREPHPLYQMLRRSGYTHRAEQRPDGMFVIRIRHAVMPPG